MAAICICTDSLVVQKCLKITNDCYILVEVICIHTNKVCEIVFGKKYVINKTNLERTYLCILNSDILTIHKYLILLKLTLDVQNCLITNAVYYIYWLVGLLLHLRLSALQVRGFWSFSFTISSHKGWGYSPLRCPDGVRRRA